MEGKTDYNTRVLERLLRRFDHVHWCHVPNMRAVLAEWMETVHATPKTWTERLREIARFYQWDFERNGAEHAPNVDDLNAFLKEKHARGVRNTSINSGLVLLRSFFVWLEDQELYTDITRGIDIEGAECYRERVALNAEQVRRLVDETTDVKMRAMFALMAFCGLRCVEVSELNWGDMSDGRAVVRGKGRNAKTEVIVLPISVQRALEDWRRVTQAQTDGDAPVFVYSRRKATSLRMSPAGISTDVQRALREVFPDIPNLSAHCLRHTAITLAIESGLDVTRVAKFARHKDIKTTMVYIHDNKKFTDPVSGRIEAMVQGERTSHDAQAIESIVRDVLRKLLRL